jgi:hypothetical protein
MKIFLEKRMNFDISFNEKRNHKNIIQENIYKAIFATDIQMVNAFNAIQIKQQDSCFTSDTLTN